jgi:hypothetical protein
MSDREEEVYSATLSAGSRTYFFDIRDSLAGRRYLAITEMRGIDDDEIIQRRVIVMPEDVLAFNEEIGKALRWIFAGDNPRFRSRPSMSEGGEAGTEAWTEKQEDALRKEYLRVGACPTIDELASLLHKKPSEVKAKLREMRLL